MSIRFPPSDDPEIEKKRQRWREKRARFVAKNPTYFRDRHRRLTGAKPAETKARKRQYYLSALDKNRARHLWKNYQITPEQYEEILKAQDYSCGICGIRDLASGRQKYGHVDHDHAKQKGEEGFIRGILCSDCNMAAGKFRDDPKRMRKAADWYGNFTGNGLSIPNLKCETWASNQNHEERHFFQPASEIGYQSSKYIFGYNPTIISEAKVARIWQILEEPDALDGQ